MVKHLIIVDNKLVYIKGKDPLLVAMRDFRKSLENELNFYKHIHYSMVELMKIEKESKQLVKNMENMNKAIGI